jgi:hypothetical protein
VNETTDPLQRGDALHGSLSALPSWMALDFMSWPSATDMSFAIEGRLREDVVSSADLVPYVREGQEQVLAGLDGLVVDPGLGRDLAGEVGDALGRDVRRFAGRAKHLLGLGADLAGLLRGVDERLAEVDGSGGGDSEADPGPYRELLDA